MYAVLDAVDSEDFAAVIVATFPPGVSQWLAADLIHRLERTVDLPITHVVAG
ncbi:MAG: hypothetical protein OEM97_07610 [Acidimicrobiia bacterium]|nr:hypothetical protein [Acidimicrobiia bacterium]